MVDPKGTVVEVPIEKPHKNRKKYHPFVKKTPKKAKLLASAMSAAETATVHLGLFSRYRIIGFSSKFITVLY